MIETKTTLGQAKSVVWAALQSLPGNGAGASGAVKAKQAVQAHFSPACECHVFHPINTQMGADALAAHFWQPLLHALPNAERRMQLFFAGEFDGRFCGGAGTWVTAHSYLLGTFVNDWLGIPATGQPLWVRLGEFYRVEGQQIVEARILLDFVDVMRQAGFAVLPPSRGQDLLVPGPQNGDGCLLTEQDSAESNHTMQVLEGMMGGLGKFNQKDLASMGMHAHWHRDMMWYGPCGIGSTRCVEGFQQHHQQPFLHAFPDRKGGNHRARIAEGHYVASTGWPSLRATHAGDYLGASATHKPISMRVADWWRREGDVLRENWVMIDLPELLLQMGVDLFDRMAQQRR
jgi:predicted ester cyclase